MNPQELSGGVANMHLQAIVPKGLKLYSFIPQTPFEGLLNFISYIIYIFIYIPLTYVRICHFCTDSDNKVAYVKDGMGNTN